MELCNALKVSRESKGLSQSKLARLSGIPQRSISHWEAGRGIPRIDVAVKLVEVLGISLDDLIDMTKEAHS